MSFEQQVVDFYKKKRQGGKYVDMVKMYCGTLVSGGTEKVELFVFFIEACKKANISQEQPENWHKLKQETWGKDPRFINSAPVKTMKAIEDQMRQACIVLGIPKGTVLSWGAFVQAFSNQIELISKYNWTMTPEAQSFHYSRAFYMVNTAEDNYAYIVNRMKACKKVYNAVVAKVNLDSYEAGNIDRARELTNKMKEAFPDIVGKGTQDFLDRMRSEQLSITDGTPFINAVAAAYPVRITMFFQSRDLRQNGFNPTMKKHVIHLFHMVVPGMKGKLNLKDNLAKAMQEYYKQYAIIRFCAATMRRVLSGDTRQSGPKKDYSAWTVDMGEDEALDWDKSDAGTKKFLKFFGTPNDNSKPNK